MNRYYWVEAVHKPERRKKFGRKDHEHGINPPKKPGLERFEEEKDERKE